jgi:chaperonin GroEL (HSP60 family)
LIEAAVADAFIVTGRHRKAVQGIDAFLLRCLLHLRQVGKQREQVGFDAVQAATETTAAQGI